MNSSWNGEAQAGNIRTRGHGDTETRGIGGKVPTTRRLGDAGTRREEHGPELLAHETKYRGIEVSTCLSKSLHRCHSGKGGN